MTASDAESNRKARHTYGRRKGHPLTASQVQRLDVMMPHLRPDLSRPAPAPLTDLFGPGIRAVWLEIGFGGGEHLAWQAAHNPDVGMIGAEPFLNGQSSLASHIEDGGLANVRMYDDGVQDLLAWLPPASIGRAFILFPDPWPKKRHIKRRIVSPKTLVALARVMVPGAELRVATDIGEYVRTTMLAVNGSPDFLWPALTPAEWCERSADWPPTRYEAKAVAAGRKCHYFRFVRR